MHKQFGERLGLGIVIMFCHLVEVCLRPGIIRVFVLQSVYQKSRQVLWLTVERPGKFTDGSERYFLFYWCTIACSESTWNLIAKACDSESFPLSLYVSFVGGSEGARWNSFTVLPWFSTASWALIGHDDSCPRIGFKTSDKTFGSYKHQIYPKHALIFGRYLTAPNNQTEKKRTSDKSTTK